MNVMRVLVAAGIAAAGLFSAGCASAPAEVRVQGIALPASLVDAAEHGQASACLAVAERLWDRDVLEALRFLRKGAERRDGESCRRYLAHAESGSVNLSQRVYARLFVEGQLRKGPLLSRRGDDLRAELYGQLGWAWRTTEPRSAAKAAQIQDALRESDARRQEILMYAGESADDMKRWLQVPLLGEGPGGDWTVFDANAWGGGSDRLLLGTNVLAFLVNAEGEPCFRGTHLWICNLGARTVTVHSLATGLTNRELLPGQEVLAPLIAAGTAPVTGIPLSIRYRRPAR